MKFNSRLHSKKIWRDAQNKFDSVEDLVILQLKFNSKEIRADVRNKFGPAEDLVNTSCKLERHMIQRTNKGHKFKNS